MRKPALELDEGRLLRRSAPLIVPALLMGLLVPGIAGRGRHPRRGDSVVAGSTVLARADRVVSSSPGRASMVVPGSRPTSQPAPHKAPVAAAAPARSTPLPDQGNH